MVIANPDGSSCTFSEGDALYIIDSKVAAINNWNDYTKSLSVIPEEFIGVPLLVRELSLPDGQGGDYPLLVENIHYKEELLRSFVFESERYRFEKISIDLYDNAYDEQRLKEALDA